MASKEYYIKECDRVFSIVMRQKGMDFDGVVKCCTCPKRAHWSFLTCGHFRKRRYMTTRWEICNGGPQCSECNGRDDENEMIPYLIAVYGEGVIEKLVVMSHKDAHYTVDQIKKKIDKFTDMIISC